MRTGPADRGEVLDAGSPPAQYAGLSEAEATTRLATDGPNVLVAEPRRRWWQPVLAQLKDATVLVLLAAAAATVAVGDVPDTVVILTVIVLNTAIGTLQAIQSERSLAVLASLTAPRATVIRDGAERDVDSTAVVVGDLLRLRTGDIVAADARVVSASCLELDESVLTGESLPVSRGTGSPVTAGTVVTRGTATATVTATGRRTRIAGISAAVAEPTGATPLQRQLNTLGMRLAMIVAAAAAIVGGVQLLGGHGVETSLVLAVSLAVAAIPESLPAVVAVSLSLAARRMAGGGVLVRRLAAVEEVGSLTVLATDKTGTLTTGRMSLAGTWTPDDSAGQLDDLLRAAVLCNDAHLPGDPAGARDDATELALVVAAVEHGIDVTGVRRASPRTRETAFDPQLAAMTTDHGLDVPPRSITKGAPESVLTADDPPAAHGWSRDRAAEGMRVLAVAQDVGTRRTLLGLVALADPPRADAAATVASLERAGVRTVMITGDHAGTARAVASRVGIAPSAVFARVTPERKRGLVRGLRSDGEIVAMTGDGVNDAPALRTADVGIAMGRRGTEVAKHAADLVLTDDSLAALVPAVAEGRRVRDNLTRFLHYAMAGGVAELLVMFVGPGLGLATPLAAGQILWVNLLTHGLPGVALSAEPAEPDVLARRPLPPSEPLLNRRVLTRLLILGTAIALACLAVGVFSRSTDRPWQSTVFVTLTLSQLGCAIALRSRSGRLRDRSQLLGSVALNTLLIWLAVAWHPLRELLATRPLSASDLALCLLAAALPVIVASCQAARPSVPSRRGTRRTR